MTHSIGLLMGINDSCNEITTGDTSENYGHGKCLYQTEEKLRRLKAHGIPAKRGTCRMTKDDPWHPPIHFFALAELDGTWYILDNGSITDKVQEYEKVKDKWGIKNFKESEVM
jgi:hypothetical protein